MGDTDQLAQIRTRVGADGRGTPQTERARPDQVRNDAGGYVFEIGQAARVHRFLTLGSPDTGTYYASPPKLARDSAGPVLDWARTRTRALTDKTVEISAAGRAPKNDQALFALAACLQLGGRTLGDDGVSDGWYAGLALPQVARTGEHLMHFVTYALQFGGWGRLLRAAVLRWYTEMDPERLAYQLVKYRRRHGYSHRDLLSCSHRYGRADRGAVSLDDPHERIFHWLFRDGESQPHPEMIAAYEQVRGINRAGGTRTARAAAYIKVIGDHPGLPWEALPDDARTWPETWRALVEAGMPMTALIRNLANLTNLGVLTPGSAHLGLVRRQLTDADRLRAARVHPMQLLLAAKTYASGQALRGKQTWQPVAQLTDALNDGYYAAFPAVEPAGKRFALCTDISGSMHWTVGGYPFIAVEIVAALALVIAATEPETAIYGFDDTMIPLNLSPRRRIDDAIASMFSVGGYGTDCSLPFKYALDNRLEFDVFVCLTDNQSWAGTAHVHERLARYREATGIPARLAVLSVYPTRFSIADPLDPGTIDFPGMDSAVPVMLADFARGDL
jgi:60 kDa SS-A/Ro ribonucleoprotein